MCLGRQGAQSPLIIFPSEPGKYQVWLPVSEVIEQYTLTSQVSGSPVECVKTVSRLGFAHAVVEYCDMRRDTIPDIAPEDVLAPTGSSSPTVVLAWSSWAPRTVINVNVRG
jgi:hypothetical protein